MIVGGAIRAPAGALWAPPYARGGKQNCGKTAVWLGTNGGADGIAAHGLPALVNLIAEFVANGGKIWLCGACTKPRGIAEGDTAPGATIVGAVTIIEANSNGATPIAFA